MCGVEWSCGGEAPNQGCVGGRVGTAGQDGGGLAGWGCTGEAEPSGNAAVEHSPCGPSLMVPALPGPPSPQAWVARPPSPQAWVAHAHVHECVGLTKAHAHRECHRDRADRLLPRARLDIRLRCVRNQRGRHRSLACFSAPRHLQHADGAACGTQPVWVLRSSCATRGPMDHIWKTACHRVAGVYRLPLARLPRPPALGLESCVRPFVGHNCRAHAYPPPCDTRLVEHGGACARSGSGRGLSITSWGSWSCSALSSSLTLRSCCCGAPSRYLSACSASTRAWRGTGSSTWPTFRSHCRRGPLRASPACSSSS